MDTIVPKNPLHKCVKIKKSMPSGLNPKLIKQIMENLIQEIIYMVS